MQAEQGFRVTYTVAGFPGEQSAGPYADEATAREHMRDIAGFEGVSNARIVPPGEVQRHTDVDLR